jgi:hypothetical protein
MSTSDAATAAGPDPIERLAAAEADLATARERVDEFGEAELEGLADAYEEFTALLVRYEEPATGDGNFETFIEFQGRVETFVERLPDDLLLREVFEECDEHLQQRRLSESDFEHVREQLEPVADLVERLEERDRAREEYQRARRAVRDRRRELEEEIEALRRLERLGAADLEAPTERLRTPIEVYNERVTDAFAAFRNEAPTREVFAFLEATTAYPLVAFPALPEDLREYVTTHPPGTEPIPRLLEYADYSRSKLDHYVDDPVALEEGVGSHETYLRRLDADPLRVAWPPPPAGRLGWRCRELTAAVNRFAPPVVEELREVAALPRETDYGRLRESAVAESELTADEHARLERGAVSEDLEAALAERERLTATLEEYPDL